MQFVKINDIKDNLVECNNICNIESLKLFARYYQEYYKENFIDLTFVVVENNKILAYVLCCILGDNITLPDGGVVIKLCDAHINDKEKQKSYISILEHLKSLSDNHKCSLTIKDFLANGSLSILGAQLFNSRFHSKLTFEMQIDYVNFNADEFYVNVRRRYKPFINWGKKNLIVTNINKDNLCFVRFKEFQDFHFKISGRKTRSDESWNKQYEMIKSGLGELILADYNGQLAAGAFFADYDDASVYFTGVFDRELFDFGLSHFILYEGINRSFERGNTSRFSLGYFDTDIKDPKWYNIQFFKKGFCRELKPTIFWSKETNK